MNAPGYFPNEPTFRVQDLLFPAEGRPEDLYLRADPAPEPGPEGLRCAAGTRLDFGTWVNSFYLGFWAAHAPLPDLALRISLTGTARLRVEWRLGEEAQCLAEKELEAAGETYVLPLRPVAEEGRLALVVDCLGPCLLHDAQFVTGKAPQPVRLSVGICSFNRDAQLRETLRKLAAIRPALPELAEVIVVNQGAALAPETLALAGAAGARILEQGNLGGAGGFARTMAEVLRSDPAPTHHLLMDDDITLDPRILCRLVDALAQAGPDRALGGAMLETERPRVLHEAGARLQPGWLVQSVGMGRSLVREPTLALFDRVPEVSYNGWWFCAVPVAVMRAEGLPMPVFIRGDDIEYGSRIRAAGVPSVSVPGCSVWHDAFAAKAQPWLTYYDYRNLLINAALAPGLAPPPRPVDVLGAIFARLLCHQYRTAEALQQAIWDFLAGPALLRGASVPGEADRLHAELRRRFGQPDGVPTGEVAPPQPRPLPVIPASVPRAVLLFLARFLAISAGIARGRMPRHSLSPQEIQPASAGPGPCLQRADPEGKCCALLRPSRRHLWLGSLQGLWCWGQYLLRYRASARAWRDGAGALRSAEAWEERFRG